MLALTTAAMRYVASLQLLWKSVQDVVFRTAISLHRHRGSRYLLHFLLAQLLGFLFLWLAYQHGLTSRALVLAFIVTPLACLAVSFLLVELPNAVVASYERRFATIEVRVLKKLDEIIAASNSLGLSRSLPVAQGLRQSLRAIQTSTQPLLFFTPYALLALADVWQEEIEEISPNEAFADAVSRLAPTSSTFRDELHSYQGEVHWIIPDPSMVAVQVFLKRRARELDLDPDFLLRKSRETVHWARRLKAARERQGRVTAVHLTQAVPGYRIFLSDDCIFCQPFTIGKPAILEPMFKLDVTVDQDAYTSLHLALLFWTRHGQEKGG